MLHRRFSILIFLLLIIVFLPACNNNKEPTNIVGSNEGESGSPSIVITPSNNFTKKSETPHADILNSKCPSFVAPNLNTQYKDLQSFEESVVSNLNMCASPAGITKELMFMEQSGFSFMLDLNQDGIPEIITGGNLHFSESFTNSNVVVFYFDGEEYKSKEIYWGTFGEKPFVEGIADVNNDGLPNVILLIFGGGQVCREEVKIIGWYENRAIDYFRDDQLTGSYPYFLSCSAVTEYKDIDNDNVFEIIQTPQTDNGNPTNSPVIFKYNSYAYSYGHWNGK